MSHSVFVAHLAGARRGQRQSLPAEQRIRFGRHPDCEVAFHPQRDLDASTRHAELRPSEHGWLLVDLGSSNGTFVGGQRVTEAPVAKDQAVEIEFGRGGPRVRVFVGTEEAAASLPEVAAPAGARRWLWLALGLAAVSLALAAFIVR